MAYDQLAAQAMGMYGTMDEVALHTGTIYALCLEGFSKSTADREQLQHFASMLKNYIKDNLLVDGLLEWPVQDPDLLRWLDHGNGAPAQRHTSSTHTGNVIHLPAFIDTYLPMYHKWRTMTLEVVGVLEGLGDRVPTADRAPKRFITGAIGYLKDSRKDVLADMTSLKPRFDAMTADWRRDIYSLSVSSKLGAAGIARPPVGAAGISRVPVSVSEDIASIIDEYLGGDTRGTEHARNIAKTLRTASTGGAGAKSTSRRRKGGGVTFEDV
jgi:hypothetical protein